MDGWCSWYSRSVIREKKHQSLRLYANPDLSVDIQYTGEVPRFSLTMMMSLMDYFPTLLFLLFSLSCMSQSDLLWFHCVFFYYFQFSNSRKSKVTRHCCTWLWRRGTLIWSVICLRFPCRTWKTLSTWKWVTWRQETQNWILFMHVFVCLCVCTNIQYAV